jgi:uncharacterized membrane protein YhaH (DUF805 family)
MESAGPHSPPQTDLGSDQEKFAPVKIFSTRGRIGRLRYIAFTVGLSLAISLIISGVSVMVLDRASENPNLTSALMFAVLGLGYGSMLVINIMLTIQRCHDFDTTGWFSLLLLLPFVPLIFWFIPGTGGVNRFGPPAMPDKGSAVTTVVILSLAVIFAIMALKAIPAFI